MRMTGEAPIAIVTGASGGIGRALFEDLATDYRVIGTSTTQEGADRLTQLAEETPGLQGIGSVLDLADPENIEAWYKEMSAEHGKANLLINNAGVTMDNVYLRQTPDVSAAIMDINFRSPWELMRVAGRDIQKSGGAIVNISSVVSVLQNPSQSLYGASKAALNYVTMNIPAETKGKLRAVSLALGPVDTPMWGSVPEEFQQSILLGTDSGEPLSLESVVKAVRTVIASDLSGVVVHHNDGLWTPPAGDPHHYLLSDIA